MVDDAGRAPSAAVVLHAKSRRADDAGGYQGDPAAAARSVAAAGAGLSADG